MVMTRADYTQTHGLNIQSYTAPWTGGVNEYGDTNFTETLIGPSSRDWVKFITATGAKYALGLQLADGSGGNYTRELSKLYFCNKFDLNDFMGDVPRPSWSTVYQTVKFGRQAYIVDRQMSLTFGTFTRAQVETFEGLYGLRTDPIFLYDEDGYVIQDKLWHGLILDYEFTPTGAAGDVFTLRIDTARIEDI
jgi:hypothetical protein